MTIHIEVLYSDLTRQKFSLDQINQLQKHSVLFIMVTTDEEEGKLQNLCHASDKDLYAFCWKKDMGKVQVALYGYDNEFTWRSGCNTCQDRIQVVHIPFDCLHVTFQGINVNQEVWKQALKIFNREMI